MAPPLDENSAPEAFAGHPEAGVSPYYKAMAKDLGGAQTSPGAKAIRVKDILKGQYARSKLGAMFRLTSSQFDKVLTQAGAAVEWRDMVEETAGGKFAAPECPSSARLMVVSASGENIEGHGEVTVVKVNTVSDALGTKQIDRVIVPKVVFQSLPFEVMDAANVQLRAPDITALSRSFVLWVWCMTGKFNIGAPLCRHAAKQFDARHKLGLDPKSPGGKDLLWMGILLRQARLMDRSDASVRPHSLYPVALPLSLTAITAACPQRIIRIKIKVQQVDMCQKARDVVNKFAFLLVCDDATKTKYPDPLVGEIPSHQVQPESLSYPSISSSLPTPQPLEFSQPSPAIPPLLPPAPYTSHPSYNPSLPLALALPLPQQPSAPTANALFPTYAAVAGGGASGLEDFGAADQASSAHNGTGVAEPTYEEKRLQQIEANKAKLTELGVQPLTKTLPPKKKRQRAERPPVSSHVDRARRATDETLSGELRM